MGDSTPRTTRSRWIGAAALVAFTVLVHGIALGSEAIPHGRPEIDPHPRIEGPVDPFGLVSPGPRGAADPGLVVVPEPETRLLFGFGLVILGGLRRAQRIRARRRLRLDDPRGPAELEKAGEEAIRLQ